MTDAELIERLTPAVELLVEKLSEAVSAPLIERIEQLEQQLRADD